MVAEFEHIAWLRSELKSSPAVIIGPGDDAAFVQLPSSKLLITTDMLMDGVDFRLSETDPRRVGRKAMAVNLSDIAAMAGLPRTAVVSLALPKGLGTDVLVRELTLGMAKIAEEYDVVIVGGDTNSWNGPLVISITLHGEATGSGPVTRAGAEPGDWLFVTGPLGGSIHGHHLDFTPRVHEALKLHREVKLKAMIDISDGFTQDLQHILEQSGCGADIIDLPIRERSNLEGAMHDGEDFELIFAVPPDDGPRVNNAFHVGYCIEKGLFFRGQPIESRGWVHRFE